MQSKKFFIAKEEKTYPAGEGATRQFVAYDNDITVVKVMFETGAIGAIHTHPHTQGCYVAKGIFEVEINGEKETLKEGDGFYAEPNIPHGVTCIEEGTLIDIFSPCREDFLKTI
ncbi:quercetin dioxygenase-like cupin family protein [Dysgonomonadaceae bacterium PH5-43]|nr:quercetin dioxygenase-like cupin family protein [Dysgonomonadaceae bacterium PH5-43]